MVTRKSKAQYIEPADYFPEEIRKRHKLGEYDESAETEKEKAPVTGSADAHIKKASLDEET